MQLKQYKCNEQYLTFVLHINLIRTHHIHFTMCSSNRRYKWYSISKDNGLHFKTNLIKMP